MYMIQTNKNPINTLENLVSNTIELLEIKYQPQSSVDNLIIIYVKILQKKLLAVQLNEMSKNKKNSTRLKFLYTYISYYFKRNHVTA